MFMAEQYHHGNLKHDLIHLALEELERVGLEDLSLRALAEALGVSKTAPYRHFATKRDLLVSLAAEGYEQFADLLESWERKVVRKLSPDTIQKDMYAMFCNFAQTYPERYRLMFSRFGNSLHSERCKQNATRAFSVLIRAASAIYPEHADPRTTSLSMFAQLHGWAMLLIDDLIPPETSVNKDNWLDSLLTPGRG